MPLLPLLNLYNMANPTKPTQTQPTAKPTKAAIHQSPNRGRRATPHQPAHLLTERWFLVDAKDRILGRLATGVAKLLMGKDLSGFNPAVDAKTNVVIINAKHIRLSGNKMADKQYHRHSGYPGGLKSASAGKVMGTFPIRLLESAVQGMLPKNKLNKIILRQRLKIYADDTHPHAGQQPTPITL